MNLIEAKELCLNEYVNGLSLKNISFEINEKGVYGFLGKANSGKSALSRVLCGVCAPDSGTLCYKEKLMYSSSKNTAKMKRKIGYAPQNCFFDAEMTAFEVLDLTGKAKGTDPDKRYRQIKEALELVGLSLKTETLVQELNLSEKKRLSIANAIISNPDVLIFDEPLKYLDKDQSNDVKKIISMLSAKKIVLVFASRPSEIEEMCEHTALMSRGKIVLWDRVDNILNKLNANGISGLDAALEAFDREEDEGGTVC